MSQENVKIVQGAFAEFERGNFWVPEILIRASASAGFLRLPVASWRPWASTK